MRELFDRLGHVTGRPPSVPPPGQRFATDDDHEDSDWKGPVEVAYPEAEETP